MTRLKDNRRKAKYLKMFQNRFWAIVESHSSLCFGPDRPGLKEFIGTLGADLHMKAKGEHLGMDEWRMLYTKPLWMLGRYYERTLLNLKKPPRRFDEWGLALRDFTFVMAQTVAYEIEPITLMVDGYDISPDTENMFNEFVKDYEDRVRQPFAELTAEVKKTVKEFSGIIFQVDKPREIHKTRVE